MELRSAKLCLDCDEIHTDRMCPLCASESFAYLTRWVPVADRTPGSRPAAPAVPAEPRGSTSMRWARRGAAGVALVAISQWLWRNSRPVEWTESGSGGDDRGA